MENSEIEKSEVIYPEDVQIASDIVMVSIASRMKDHFYLEMHTNHKRRDEYLRVIGKVGYIPEEVNVFKWSVSTLRDFYCENPSEDESEVPIDIALEELMRFYNREADVIDPVFVETIEEKLSEIPTLPTIDQSSSLAV